MHTLCACVHAQMLAGTRAFGTCIWYGWVGEPEQHIRIPDFFNKTLTNFIIYSWQAPAPHQCHAVPLLSVVTLRTAYSTSADQQHGLQHRTGGNNALTAASCRRHRLPAQGTERIHKLFEEGFEMFRSGVLKVLPGECAGIVWTASRPLSAQSTTAFAGRKESWRGKRLGTTAWLALTQQPDGKVQNCDASWRQHNHVIPIICMRSC